MEWHEVIESSLYHGTLPRLYAGLSEAERSAIPAAVLSLLKRSYETNLDKNNTLWAEFVRIHREFTAAGIAMVPLKGIILSRTLYTDSAVRPMTDIDVLVREDGLIAGEAILEKLGYRLQLRGFSRDYWRRFQCHYTFRHETSGIIFEMHWSFAPARPRRLDIAECWQRTANRVVEGVPVQCLSDEDMLLALCLHLGRNISSLRAIRLRQLYDIHELVLRASGTLDTAYIERKIREWGIRKMFVYLAGLTSAHLSTVWPESFHLPPAPPARPLRGLSRIAAQSLLFSLQDTAVDRFALIRLAVSMSLNRSMR